jgi:polyhydroxyalkanoate synthase
MADQQHQTHTQAQDHHHHLPDPEQVSKAMSNIAERSQRLVNDFLSRQAQHPETKSDLDPMNVGKAFMEMTARLMSFAKRPA